MKVKIMNRKLSYNSQLKRKEWKLKRKEILERDCNKCCKCGSSKNLHVHHKEYLPNKLAWEYDNDYLITLCANCHKIIHTKNLPTTINIEIVQKENTVLANINYIINGISPEREEMLEKYLNKITLFYCKLSDDIIKEKLLQIFN